MGILDSDNIYDSQQPFSRAESYNTSVDLGPSASSVMRQQLLQQQQEDQMTFARNQLKQTQENFLNKIYEKQCKLRTCLKYRQKEF